MNAAFLLAGTVSSNPVMFILATWVVLAWRVAGYYGLDYWVLPRIGAPHGGFGVGRRPSGEGEPEPTGRLDGRPKRPCSPRPAPAMRVGARRISCTRLRPDRRRAPPTAWNGRLYVAFTRTRHNPPDTP